MNRRGYDIIPYDDYTHKLGKVKYNWLKNLGIHTVIDVGASDGGYGRKIRAILPEAQIISFEPLPSSFAELNRKFSGDPHFRSYNLALSDVTGESVFYQNRAEGCSSLLPMGELHKTVYPGSEFETPIQVRCDRLDRLFPELGAEKKILLKIDVQGAEKKVLEGCSGILSDVDVVFCEVSFRELYNGSTLFDEMVSYMMDRHFRLEGIENISQSLIDGTFLQADVFFINTVLR